MMARAAFLAMALSGVANAALAFSAQDATDCAAFSLANWDYEVDNFDAADRSPEWKAQAEGFKSVSTRMGHGRQQIDSRIAGMRPAFRKMLDQFIFSGDTTAERQFRSISRVCDGIFDAAPEMAPYR